MRNRPGPAVASGHKSFRRSVGGLKKKASDVQLIAMNLEIVNPLKQYEGPLLEDYSLEVVPH